MGVAHPPNCKSEMKENRTVIRLAAWKKHWVQDYGRDSYLTGSDNTSREVSREWFKTLLEDNKETAETVSLTPRQ